MNCRRKKSIFRILSIFIIATITMGCSFTTGNIGHSVQTQVHLSQANFDVIKSATGEAKADYFFGIGPSEQNLTAQAKRDMINKAGIKGSQALINITTDIKSSGFFVWRQKKVYVSAEVIQFK